MSADILFDMAQSHVKQPAATAAFEHLFSPTADGAHLFTSAASEYASFGELACADPSRAASLNGVAASVNAHVGGLYQGKTECLRSTICTPQLGLDGDGVCASIAGIES